MLITLIVILSLFLIVSISFIIRYNGLKRKAFQKISLMIKDPSNKWTPDFLTSKRAHTDPLADRVVDIIMKKGEMTGVNHLFSRIVTDHASIPEDFPVELKEYFQQTSQLPDWADPTLLALGQEFYIRNGIWISLLLSYKSLPECYACAKGAEVLFHTGRLNEHHGDLNTYSRRIAETAQYVLYVMSPGGLSATGRGLRAVQKVRLIHAVIRHYLKKKNWDNSKFDEPINQEDMAGTLMSFSALILEGLAQLNVKVDEAEKEAYVHCWRVIGHMMGLNDDIIPSNSADALKLGHTILDQQAAESEHGKFLMDALLVFQHKLMSPMMSEQTNIDMMRFMMGKKISDMLGVPSAEEVNIQRLAKRIRRIVAVAEFIDRTVIFAGVVQIFHKALLQLMIRHMSKSKIINFYLPKSLTMDWGTKTNQ